MGVMDLTARATSRVGLARTNHPRTRACESLAVTGCAWRLHIGSSGRLRKPNLWRHSDRADRGR